MPPTQDTRDFTLWVFVCLCTILFGMVVYFLKRIMDQYDATRADVAAIKGTIVRVRSKNDLRYTVLKMKLEHRNECFEGYEHLNAEHDDTLQVNE
jgi:hypothetical protein